MLQKYRHIIGGILIIMILVFGASCREHDGHMEDKISEADKKREQEPDQLLPTDDQETLVIESGVSLDDSKEVGAEVDAPQKVDENTAAVEALLEEMTIEEKVGQLFYLDLQSYAGTKIPAGGIIFFRHDLITWASTIEAIQGYQKASKLPLFVGIDEEGGIITRITGAGSIGGTAVDSSWHLSHSGEDDAVYLGSATIASELDRLGFNMNFAPVADINSNPNNPIIGKRAFSDNPEETAYYVVEALSAYEPYKVIPVVKHFPGHGNTQGDSHNDLVYIEGDMEQLMANELMPFRAAIEEGVQVIMMGHIILSDVPTIEAQVASMNKDVIQGLLIDELGFTGIVISDSLLMGSISNHMTVEEVIDQGLYAGLDMFLMPESPGMAYDYLVEKAKSSDETLARVEVSVKKILLLKEQLE